MSYLKITPGVSVLSDVGRPLKSQILNMSDESRSRIIERDEHTCQYCGFKAEKYQDINYVDKDNTPSEGSDPVTKDDLYVTSCIFCQQCFQVEKLGYMQSGTIIWLPEIGQAALNHICRAIYVARITQGPMADAARDVLEALTTRKEEAVKRLGTDNPRILASVLHDFLEAKEYRYREKKLEGFRILPLDRRIIKEGELEFNQFPQILAYWRSKDGPYGEVMPRNWLELFFETKSKLNPKSDDIAGEDIPNEELSAI